MFNKPSYNQLAKQYKIHLHLHAHNPTLTHHHIHLMPIIYLIFGMHLFRHQSPHAHNARNDIKEDPTKNLVWRGIGVASVVDVDNEDADDRCHGEEADDRLEVLRFITCWKSKYKGNDRNGTGGQYNAVSALSNYNQ